MAKEAAWKTTKDVADALCRAGLIGDPSMVKRVVITVDHVEATTVQVTSFVQPDAVDHAMREITQKFDLVPREGR